MICCAIIAFFLCFVFIFYISRHSWATIAVNKAGIDKYTVHAALNHRDETMRITDIYIERDFKIENDANTRVVKYVFEEK